MRYSAVVLWKLAMLSPRYSGVIWNRGNVMLCGTARHVKVEMSTWWFSESLEIAGIYRALWYSASFDIFGAR